jgi:hypothetical protein
MRFWTASTGFTLLFLKSENIPHSRLGTGTAGKSYAAVGKIGAPTSPSAHHQP